MSDLLDLLAELDQPPMRGPWPHFIDGVPARGIVSMTPPTVRCDGCGAESTHPKSVHIAVVCGGYLFRLPRYGEDPRRLCPTCRWDEWPEHRISDMGHAIPRPEREPS